MDDVILNKIASIERCLQRIEEEYRGFEQKFSSNYTKQDSVILNLQRACEQTIDLANYLVRQEQLGVPQSARDSFQLLANANMLPAELAQRMQSMVGFRNIAIHAYQALDLTILVSILEHRLNDFTRFTQTMFGYMEKSSVGN